MSRISRAFGIILTVLVVCRTQAATPEDPCAVVARSSIESILGGVVKSTDVQETRAQRLCILLVQVGDTPGKIRIGLFKHAPATPESGITMQPLDKVVPVSGIGDEALVNTNTQEIKFRRGDTWYHISTHTAPCHGDTQSADDSVRRACADRRNELMMGLARAVASG